MSRLIEERQDAVATAAAAASEAGGACPAKAAAPLLTVIVPVYNEAATIEELLRRVVAAPLDMQVVVVDDGSTDATTSVLEHWEGHPLVELLAHSRNRGKGAAIRTGLDHARGRFTIVQDADLEYDPEDYPRLLAPLLAGEADVVYGSRYAKGASQSQAVGRLAEPSEAEDGSASRPTMVQDGSASRPTMVQDGSASRPTMVQDGSASRPTITITKARPKLPWSRFRLGVCLLNVAARWLYAVRLTDEATCYKVFSTEALRAMRLECERFEFCPEVTAKACRLDLRIAEVPVRYTPRGVADGKKIRCRDGWQALKELWRWRQWTPRTADERRSERHNIPNPHRTPDPENA